MEMGQIYNAILVDMVIWYVIIFGNGSFYFISRTEMKL